MSSRKITSFIINGHILFDVGFGVVNSLRENGLDVGDIDTLVISHHHPDHTGDIMYFLIRRWQFFLHDKLQNKQLTIIGPKGIKETIFAYHDVANLRDNKDEIRPLIEHIEMIIENIIELGDGENHEMPNLKIDAFSVTHSTSLTCNGYIITIAPGNARIGCSGDTCYCSSLVNNLKYSDFWIIDGAHLTERNSKRHISLEKIIKIAAEYPDKKFYCVHRDDYEIPKLPPNVFCPQDNDYCCLE